VSTRTPPTTNHKGQPKTDMSCIHCADNRDLPSFGGCGYCAARARRQIEKPAKDAAKNRRATLRRYGLTPDDYDSMLAHQRGRCAICRQPPAEGEKLVVDHDHGVGRQPAGCAWTFVRRLPQPHGCKGGCRRS
jgi:hypothetical protein